MQIMVNLMLNKLTNIQITVLIIWVMAKITETVYVHVQLKKAKIETDAGLEKEPRLVLTDIYI